MSLVTDRLYSVLHEKGKPYNVPVYTLLTDDIVCRIGELIPESEMHKFTDKDLFNILMESIKGIQKEIPWHSVAGKVILETNTYSKIMKDESKEYDVTLDTIIKVRANSEEEIHTIAMEKLKEMIENKDMIDITFDEVEED